MPKIKKLPESLIAKIAAGEVIERPAYVIKELIENSLDAQANFLIIKLEDGGLKKITIIDDGEGMSREDIQLCYQRYTTSKISQEIDLSSVQTLGFRGEALASIAAVSLLTIKSRTADTPAGTKVLIAQNNLKSIDSTGMPIGTQISVESLFENLPVRKQTLESSSKELRLIVEIVLAISLANPDVSFVLVNNGKTLYDLPKSSLENRVKTVLGSDLFYNLFPVIYAQNDLQISGFLGHPQIAGYTNKKQYFFINNRKIEDKRIFDGIKNAYGSLLDQKHSPVFILYLTIPHELIDVNIHPRKEKVGFWDSASLLQTIQQSVELTLLANHLLKSKSENYAVDGLTDSFAGLLLKDQMFSWSTRSLLQDNLLGTVTQYHNLYLAIENPDGIVFIDQHAAHERVLYERLKTSLLNKKQGCRSQRLAEPVLFEVPLSDQFIVSENLKTFEKAGFIIESFKDNQFVLQSVPEILADRNPLLIINEMLGDIFHDSEFSGIDSVSDKMLTYLACHTAIKAGDALTPSQSKKLLKELEETPNNLTCPHGRPTKVEISLKRLNKVFKRE